MKLPFVLLSRKKYLTFSPSLKIRNKGLEEMIKEQEKIINEPKASITDTVQYRQIENLKIKIAELEKEIEEQKQICHSKNNEINRLKGI